ncbi:MAG: nucleotide sugar dehydrogenase [Rhodospirillaceae bacterium]|jgi:UDP-N-acetyl-D-glucosamine/UDP-N-acetyl-D-galactosamine dehydrogenase|nr:nucleotide sugar dehydrogenase [Rhodospirillaceae bacterium]MBT6117071.1 nucleotide sugar dehydrogenase [Rhodospirillaceae bacterium]
MPPTDPSPAAHRIAVVGLGYVGLPLAVALARHFPVTGFDIDAGRVAELAEGHDRTGEVPEAVLAATTLRPTTEVEAMRGSDIFIVTVPTPVDGDNSPDLGPVRAACRTVAGVMAKGAIVVLESTVSPGVTEEVCGPILAEGSGLACGRDFFLGYSPERINPGDREHTVEHITKVVAGQTPEVAEHLAAVYGAINGGNTFVARDIRTAEAAKVIENAQRDLNIAFVNEIAMIFHRAGLSVHDVLAASRTKWNFLPFTPGLVGGHCIGVDPFYLAEFAQRIGHHPEIILSGRRINDGMARYVADRVAEAIGPDEVPDEAGRRVLVLGLTFKENVPDLRNSKVVDLARALADHGFAVDIHDPVADPAVAEAEYGLRLLADPSEAGPYACVLGVVGHDAFKAMTGVDLAALLVPGGLLADLKDMWRDTVLPEGFRRWRL